MIENIVIREAVTEEERSLFWERLRAYFCRDIFPDPEDEDRPYFLGDDYRRTMESLRTRPVHPVHWLVFSRNGQDVGFALAAVFTGEDGKCFILEFCVLPEHRGGGMGTACARTLLNWAREQGAGYAELNCTTPPRQRFWGRLGFVANGADEWGVPLMLLPPREHRPITVERLTDPTDWQLGKLENGYRQDIGEEPLTEEQQERIGDCLPQRISAVEGPWVLALPGYAAPDYQTVAALADRLFPFAKRGPMRICLEADMAKALGQALALRVGQHAEIVCIDRVKLSENQYLDIGLPQGPAFPVVVKTLVFGA